MLRPGDDLPIFPNLLCDVRQVLLEVFPGRVIVGIEGVDGFPPIRNSRAQIGKIALELVDEPHGFSFPFGIVHGIADRRKTVNALNADYDTPREDFEKYLADVARQIRENRQVVSRTQQALERAITDDEAAAIARAHTKAMQAAVAAIQAI